MSSIHVIIQITSTFNSTFFARIDGEVLNSILSNFRSGLLVKISKSIIVRAK